MESGPLGTRGLVALPEVNIPGQPADSLPYCRGRASGPRHRNLDGGVLSIVRTVLIVQDRHVVKT